jgi:hypothetical protein
MFGFGGTQRISRGVQPTRQYTNPIPEIQQCNAFNFGLCALPLSACVVTILEYTTQATNIYVSG